MDNEIAKFSDFIAAKAANEAGYYPIDRHFLNQYIDKILTLDTNDFLLYNIESGNALYSEYLMLCLPELWESITVDDLIKMINQFTSVFSFYILIMFTYKFIEIDITELIFNLRTVSEDKKKQIKNYLKNQYPSLLKTETDFFFFDKNIYGVSNKDWMYIKQKQLIDSRLKPALLSLEELEIYFS
jgi:hypothetical protein